MTRKLVTSAILAVMMSTAAYAAGSIELNDANKEQIRTVLSDQGYEVGKIKLDDGMYEAYARKDGAKYEIYLDANFAIVRVKQD